MRTALGKGLYDLIGEQTDISSAEIPIEQIIPSPFQPRKQFNEESVRELAESIREVGLIQPLVVRRISEDQYELIAGERRLKACKLAGLTSVPITQKNASNQSSLEMALVENIQREDISPIERALAYRGLIEDFQLSQEDVAKKVGKPRSSVANTLRLLKLPTPIQQSVQSGILSEGHAKALLSLDDPTAQFRLYEKVLAKNLTVRETEQAVKNILTQREALLNQAKKPNTPSIWSKSPAWLNLEDSLSIHFGSPVQLTKTEKGGKLMIEFYSDEELGHILEVLNIQIE